MNTEKINAVKFCMFTLGINFEGDVNNPDDTDQFLDNYLDEAKIIYDDARESYYSEFLY